LNPLGKHFRFADGADADVVLVDAVGVRKLVEFLTEEVEQRLVFLRRPLEVLRRERVQRQLFDADVLTPLEDAFGRFGTGPVALVGVAAPPAGVPPVPVLNHCDVCRRAGDFLESSRS